MYILECRNCGQTIEACDVVELTGMYLLHTVKNHWTEVIMIRDASLDDLIAAAKYAQDRGWI